MCRIIAAVGNIDVDAVINAAIVMSDGMKPLTNSPFLSCEFRVWNPPFGWMGSGISASRWESLLHKKRAPDRQGRPGRYDSVNRMHCHDVARAMCVTRGSEGA